MVYTSTFGSPVNLEGSQVWQGSGLERCFDRVLRHLLEHALTFLTEIIRRQYFPPALKPSRVVSIMKPGKDFTLSHIPIRLINTVRKLFATKLLTDVHRDANERELYCQVEFGLKLRHRKKRQLACLDERVGRFSDERRLTGAVL
jgi:hypothetical protein